MKYTLVDDLTKVFPQEKLNDFSLLGEESIIEGESFSFQIAFMEEELPTHTAFEVRCVDHQVCLYDIGLVPSTLPVLNHQIDDNYITTDPGMFPDVLKPIQQDQLVIAPVGQWRSVWVEITPTEKSKVGLTNVEIICKNKTLKVEKYIKINFRRLSVIQPAQTLLYTRWFHCDGICHYHKVDFASEAFFRIAKNYIRVATDHGMNMILTPLFTPPLDTKIGGDRLTTQLIQVFEEDGGYRFDFELLDQWFDICTESGIVYFEMSHLFTQWGAKHAPKIMVERDGKLVKKFGWETDAHGDEYYTFLSQFLEALLVHLKSYDLKEYIYFHVSDEPEPEHIENYTKAKELLTSHLNDYKIIDALSNVAFFDNHIVNLPVVATDHIEPFVDRHIEEFWCYYCVAQSVDVSNIYMAMPLARVRIIAVQWFKYKIKGFLHWAYNFYNTRFSLDEINPYEVTDAGSEFPSGDSFIVYPHEDGCLGSTRLKVFKSAIEDYEAMKLLSDLKGYDYVLSLIEEGLDRPITFKDYPKEPSYIKRLRERINLEIVSCQEERI